MTQLPTPAHLHEITPDWLTKALQSKEASSNALVTDYSIEPIGEGKGFINQLARLVIEYDGNFGDLPRSVIAKLPPSDPTLKAMSSKLGDNRREVRFYEEIAPQSTIQTPYLCSASSISSGITPSPRSNHSSPRSLGTSTSTPLVTIPQPVSSTDSTVAPKLVETRCAGLPLYIWPFQKK